MEDINSRTGNLLIISDDEDDDDEEQNNRDPVLTDIPPDICLTDDDTSMSYGIDVKEDRDDINAISNDGQAVTNDMQTAGKTPDDIRHSDEVTSLKLGRDADDLADENPYSDPVDNIFASTPSILCMSSIPESITDQLKIGHITASKLNLPETCKRVVDGKEDNLRKGTNSKENEKIDDSQFPIVNKQSNANEDNLRKGTHSNQKEKFDDSQFPVVNEQSNGNEDNLRKGTNSKEKETTEDSPFPVQPNADPATLSFRDKLSLLQNNPSEPEKRDKPTVPITSIKGHRSFFETSLQTGAGEIRSKPVRKSMLEQSSSFKAAREIAKLSSIGIPAKSSEHCAGEIGSKPERTSMHKPNSSFKAAREIAKHSLIGISAKSSEHCDGQIESKPEWKKRFEHNSSFEAAREKAELTSFIIKPKSFEDETMSVCISLVVVFPHSYALAELDNDEHRVHMLGVKDSTQYGVTPTKTTTKTQKDNTIVVAAIDFGTTFSAVAFSFTNDPEQIYAKTWDGQVKVPTVILLDPDKKLHSFGNDAKRAFSEKKDKQDTFEKWFYFDCFKMKLYVEDQYLEKDIKLKDFSGKEMAALDVFEKAISYMRGELLTLLNEKRRGVVINSTTDIHWVLTVPAIWPDLSKTFMREAAEKAGIPTDYLTLALEPEAASLFCRRILDVDLRGKKYIILDLGGGTADFVCHEVQHDDSIKECHMATGGAFGGKMVNDKFMERLISHYGAEIVKEFRRTKEYLDFIESFEIRKNNFDGTGDFVHIICAHTLNDIYQRKIGEPIETTIQQSPRPGKLFWKHGRLVISKDIIQGMFDGPLKSIIETTQRIIEHVKNIDHIIMVGGFSNSKYIVQGIQQSFPEEGFVVTIDNPEVAVVKGAVRFGHENKAITSRISKYTYGIGRLMTFKPGDREDYKIFANGTTWCDNCFNKHIEVGEEMNCDDGSGVKAHDYYPPEKDAKHFMIEVIASKDRNPKYTTDEGCYSIGVLPLEMDTQGDVWSKVEVKLVFKGTELEIQALDVNSGKLTTGKVDFWS